MSHARAAGPWASSRVTVGGIVRSPQRGALRTARAKTPFRVSSVGMPRSRANSHRARPTALEESPVTTRSIPSRSSSRACWSTIAIIPAITPGANNVARTLSRWMLSRPWPGCANQWALIAAMIRHSSAIWVPLGRRSPIRTGQIPPRQHAAKKPRSLGEAPKGITGVIPRPSNPATIRRKLRRLM